MENEEPTWAKLHYPPIDYQDACYYSAPKSDSDRPKSLDEVDPELLATYEKLGIPLQEQEMLAGVAVDAVFDSVSVATTFKDKLAELGIIFCSISEAVKEHPELVQRYLGSVVPYSDNFFATLNSAVFTDGSFVYVPKGVRCPMELSTYFRINAANTGQFERTLIIADEGSYVSYLEGCTAPMRDENQLHAAVVELVALDDAEIKYSTVQNWYPGDAEGKGGIYNFVTKRGACRGANAKISWTQVETARPSPGSIRAASCKATTRWASSIPSPSPTTASRPTTGTKMIHIGRNTKSRIVSKGIAAGRSDSTYRGLVRIQPKAQGARNHTQCDSLLIGGRHVGGGHVDSDAAGCEHLLALLDEFGLVGEVAAVGGVAAAGDRAGDVAAHRLVVSFPFRSGGSLLKPLRGRGFRRAHAPVEGADPAAQGLGELFGSRLQGRLPRTGGEQVPAHRRAASRVRVDERDRRAAGSGRVPPRVLDLDDVPVHGDHAGCRVPERDEQAAAGAAVGPVFDLADPIRLALCRCPAGFVRVPGCCSGHRGCTPASAGSVSGWLPSRSDVERAHRLQVRHHSQLLPDRVVRLAVRVGGRGEDQLFEHLEVAAVDDGGIDLQLGELPGAVHRHGHHAAAGVSVDGDPGELVVDLRLHSLQLVHRLRRVHSASSGRSGDVLRVGVLTSSRMYPGRFRRVVPVPVFRVSVHVFCRRFDVRVSRADPRSRLPRRWCSSAVCMSLLACSVGLVARVFLCGRYTARIAFSHGRGCLAASATGRCRRVRGGRRTGWVGRRAVVFGETRVGGFRGRRLARSPLGRGAVASAVLRGGSAGGWACWGLVRRVRALACGPS